MGAIVFGIGILYMMFVGRHLLPARETAEDRQEAYHLREYVSEIRVPPESRLAGRTLVDSRMGADYDLTVIAIIRDGGVRTAMHRDARIQADDLLVLEGAIENLMRARDKLGFVIETEHTPELEALDPEKVYVVEATLAPRSSFVGRSLRGIRFRERYGFTALAIWRHGGVISERLRDVRLQFGDALLLQGPRHRLSALQESRGFLVLEPVTLEQRRKEKALLAVGIMALVLALTSLAGYSISLAMVIGSVAMVLTGCLTMDEAYQSIEWQSVFLIAGMLPLGTAMATTGTARYLANLLVGAVGAMGPLAVLAGIYILAGLITQPMSNAAATVLMVPIAIDVALGLGANPQSFVLATVIGTSTSFLTPVGHQANVLVFGPGGYRFSDYTRVGALLNLAILIATLVFLPLLWPLFG